jgi:(R,R)-butanediol dehydrogenase / meso-butanediol dehydrogenase / diacetyl reductase
MKALRFHAKRDLRIDDVKAPGDPGPGQVRVRNRFCGICGTDVHEYVGGPIFIPTTPHPFTKAHGPQILGHEFAGVVDAVGPGVTTVSVGDRVSIQPLVMPRSDEFYANRGLFHLSSQIAVVGLSFPWGGFAEQAVVNEYNVARVPDAVSDEEAAMVEPASVAVYSCERGGVKAGDSVLVTGAGPIGLLALLAARAAGATTLFISDINDSRLALAEKAIPEVVTINPRRATVGDVVREHTEGKVGCDVALECVGNEHALKACVDAVRKRGVIVQTGLHPGESAINWFDVVIKDIELRGAFAYTTWSWPRVLNLIGSGALPVRQLVTGTIPLEAAVSEGFDALLDPAGRNIKILVDLEK